MKQVVKTVDKRVRVTRFPRQQQRQSRCVFILRKRLQESPLPRLPFPRSASTVNIYTVVRYVRWNCCRKEKCTQAGGVLYNSPEEQFRSKHRHRVQAMKDSCSRSEQSIFCSYLTDLYYYQSFNSCSSSTRGAHDGSSLPPQYSSASDPSPNDPTENSPPLSLSVALQPQVVFKLGYFQISFVKKLLSFSFLPMVCSHVCHVFQVGHTMPSRKKKERKKNRMWATGEHIGQ